MPINSTPTRNRRTAITTDSSISVVPRWRARLLIVLKILLASYVVLVLLFLFWFVVMVGLLKQPFPWAVRSTYLFSMPVTW